MEQKVLGVYVGQGSGSLSYTAGPPTPAFSRPEILGLKFRVSINLGQAADPGPTPHRNFWGLNFRIFRHFLRPTAATACTAKSAY